MGTGGTVDFQASSCFTLKVQKVLYRGKKRARRLCTEHIERDPSHSGLYLLSLDFIKYFTGPWSSGHASVSVCAKVTVRGLLKLFITNSRDPSVSTMVTDASHYASFNVGDRDLYIPPQGWAIGTFFIQLFPLAFPISFNDQKSILMRVTECFAFCKPRSKLFRTVQIKFIFTILNVGLSMYVYDSLSFSFSFSLSCVCVCVWTM